MRKIPAIIGVILLLLGLLIIAGGEAKAYTTVKEKSGSKTLEGSPGIQWLYDNVNLSAGETMKVTVTCTEPGDQVFLGIMAQDVFGAGGPWGENQFLAHSRGRNVWVSLAPTAPTEGTYYWIVQGYENWPIPFNYKVEVTTVYKITLYLGAGLSIVGAILIALSFRRRH